MPDFASILPVAPTQPVASTQPIFPAGTGGGFQMTPEFQSVLDAIKAQAERQSTSGASAATALAGRRGLAGSSVEQFGVQEAIDRANQDAQSLTANAFLGEMTSQRNANFSQQQLDLQRMLGQQGIDVAQANIAASQEMAKKQGQLSMISSLGQLLLPNLLFGGGGGGGMPGAGGGGGGLFGGGGLMARIFGGGGGGGIPGLQGGAPLVNGGIAPAAGMSSFLPMAALTAGGIMGYQSLSDTGKSIVAPLVNPVKTVQTVAKKVTNAVKKVFPF